MKKIFNTKPALITALAMTMMLTGCGGGDSTAENSSADDNNTVVNGTPLPAQSGMRSALFYGNTNHKALGSLTNVRVFDPLMPLPADVIVQSEIMEANIGRPQPGTTLVGYVPADNSYTDLYVDSLYYVNDAGNPHRVTMPSWHDMETHTDYGAEDLPHSNATGLTGPAYAEVNYLGTKRFLTATDPVLGKVIICPTADGTEVAIPFANKTFLTVWYPSYGQMASGAVVYDSTSYTFQKMVPPSAACAACNDPGTELTYTPFTGVTMTSTSKYTFLGDIGGTATSAVIVDGKLYIMDKSALTLTEKVVTPTGTTVTLANLLGTTGKAVSKFDGGGSVFYLYKGTDGVTNLYRVNLLTGALTQVSAGYGTATAIPSKIHSITDDWVIYGTDGLMLAVRKSDVTTTPIVLAENTKTSGIRYPFNFGIGSQYLYVTYSVNTATGNTTYQACVLAGDGTNTCRDNSFWVGVSAARQGKLNFTSDYPYTPYAFVRVDNTDNFGGGTIKAVDPTKPLDDGFAVGTVPTYNFNTFLHAYYYLKTTVDSDGYIVIYGKRDDNFIGDAFLLNLRQANSVRNLTNETAPSVADINSGALHCHGRYCAVCHNFAGGKIWGDWAGTVEAVGYNMKFEFADNTSVLARLGKGKGENFSALYSHLMKGDFTPVIVSASDNTTVIKSAGKLGHSGVSFSNCDYCHTNPKNEAPRYGAPGVITIAP